jgi:hypothetical protein
MAAKAGAAKNHDYCKESPAAEIGVIRLRLLQMPNWGKPS